MLLHNSGVDTGDDQRSSELDLVKFPGCDTEEAERIRQEASDKEKEEQQKEEWKKNKSKFIPIPQRGVPTMPPIIISTIAMQHMDKGNYVPLWYFTNAGLDDASKAFNIIKEDMLLLIKAGDGLMSLVPTLSSKESRNVVEDSNLSWDDFCITAPHMILAMSRSEWTPDRIAMMMEFWLNLNTHPQGIHWTGMLYYFTKQNRGSFGIRPSTHLVMDMTYLRSTRSCFIR